MFAPSFFKAESGSGPLFIATVKIPADTPDFIPSGAFSTTIPCDGLRSPTFLNPIRYGSGYGLPLFTL